MIEILFGLGMLTALSLGTWIGYLLGRTVGNKTDYPHADEPAPILVKRTRHSLRQPGKTVTTYDQYKTSKGLYAPVRPGKGNTADERDVT